jgi:hypothetical protein
MYIMSNRLPASEHLKLLLELPRPCFEKSEEITRAGSGQRAEWDTPEAGHFLSDVAD